MSNVDVHCDLITKYGNTFEAALDSVNQYQSNLSVKIASDVVSDIIDAALDIAIGKSGSGPCQYLDANWEKPCDRKLKCEFEKLAMDSPIEQGELSPNIQKIIEGLNTISVNENNTVKTEEPLRLDIEMKRLLTDMISPPYPIINYDPVSRKDGVGDQAPQHTMESEMLHLEGEDTFVDEDQKKTVEKKSRVTDLVMNSKEVLSGLYLDEKTKKNIDDWEMVNEEVVNVINYEENEHDHQVNKEVSYEKKPVCRIPEKINILSKNSQVCDEIRPYEGPIGVFDGDEDEEHILTIPNEKVMDIVDLSKSGYQEDESFLCCGMDCGNNGGKGDEYTLVTINEDEGKVKGIVGNEAHSSEQCFKKESKKKKWNLGSRLWGFIKKRPQKNKDSESSQSVTAQQ